VIPIRPEWLASKGGDIFALRVSGDSMIEAHIADGDLVLVRKQASAVAGDIVAALIDDEATVKRFAIEGGTVVLKPEHPTMKPILVDSAKVGVPNPGQGHRAHPGDVRRQVMRTAQRAVRQSRARRVNRRARRRVYVGERVTRRESSRVFLAQTTQHMASRPLLADWLAAPSWCAASSDGER